MTSALAACAEPAIHTLVTKMDWCSYAHASSMPEAASGGARSENTGVAGASAARAAAATVARGAPKSTCREVDSSRASRCGGAGEARAAHRSVR